MDDGLQFASQDRSNYPAGPDATKTIYKAGFRTASGTTWQYIGNDKSEFDAVIAKHQAENARYATFKGWRPKDIEIATEIIEPVQSVVEEVVAIEESSVIVEAPKASSGAAKTAPAYMTYNKAAHRYQAEVDGTLYCVDEDAFADRLYAACREDPTEDEYRIWSVLTGLRSWDFSGKQAGTSMPEVVHA